MYGKPGDLKEKAATTISIETEPLTGQKHEVHFNRGAIASQAFVRRFSGRELNQVGAPGYAWLGRDLLPGLLEYIGRAKDNRYGLRAAYFEMSRPKGDEAWPDVLDAFKKAASDNQADVKIIFHAKDDDTGNRNEEAIDGMKSLCVKRKNAKLMHNKFIVLLKDDKPVSVWLGSTNISKNALCGQLNVGHVINDKKTAAAFLGYWNEMKSDPVPDAIKDWAAMENDMPPADDSDEITPVFSPHHGREVFDWWIKMANSGKPLFMTFPFGIVTDFRPVFDQNDGILRFAMLDKYVNGGTKASRAAATAEIERMRRFPNIGMSLGSRIFVDWIDGWMKEPSALGVHVNWVHTKFMLVDPLGTKPMTLTGSANWSLSSVSANDEHLVVIRGDQRVADIYFGEFMRVFAHHRFRESVKRYIDRFGANAFDKWKPQDLFEDWKKWVPAHFKPGSEKDIKRRYFADE
ncbi:hypothetical protein GC197_07105 [bacterium]|nr:hypothetical protein [bacterium]